MELNAQQEKFLAGYLDPNSPTYGNAKQSALAANYSKDYADNITVQMPNWLAEYMGDNEVLRIALKNLQAFLEGDNESIKWDATKFSLKSLQSRKWGDKIDHTTKGEKLPTPILAHVHSDSSNEEIIEPKEEN